MIRFIHCNDYARVLRIWQACFGDEESYVRFFWENCFPQCRGLIYEAGGQAVSMLFLLPGTLAYKKTSLPAEYVYAVATMPEYRGRGYATELTKQAAGIAQSEGKSALCLRPGEESLYGYYAKLGFVKAFARHERAARRGCFAWSPPVEEYIRRESELTGRELFYRPMENPGGMLLPLGRDAEKWLRKTKGRAYMGPALE